MTNIQLPILLFTLHKDYLFSKVSINTEDNIIVYNETNKVNISSLPLSKLLTKELLDWQTSSIINRPDHILPIWLPVEDIEKMNKLKEQGLLLFNKVKEDLKDKYKVIYDNIFSFTFIPEYHY